MGMGSGNHQDEMADINVTPLVDVMLVLLIIFMVTTPMMNSAGVEIQLPQSEAPPLEDDPDKTQLILTIDAEQLVYIGENPFTMDEVPEKLTAIAKQNPDQEVFLRADASVPYGTVARLLGVAKRAGMPKIGLVFEPTGEEAQ